MKIISTIALDFFRIKICLIFSNFHRKWHHLERVRLQNLPWSFWEMAKPLELAVTLLVTSSQLRLLSFAGGWVVLLRMRDIPGVQRVETESKQ